MKRYIEMMISAVAFLILGSSGAIVTSSSISVWYEFLTKPFFAPPNWIFGPVWTLLYISLGVSFYLVWEKGLRKTKVRDAIRVFFVQFGFNLVWSYAFFGLRSPELAFVDIVILWGLIVLTIKYFYPISKTAGILLLPYLAWVSFATVLNLYIVMLN